MKKIIISVGIFLGLGFTYNQYPTPNQSVFRYEYEILSNLDEWIKEDINNGRMEEDIGEIYLESIEDLRKSLINHEVSLTCKRTYDEYTD